jgi:uncharacterized membrane protein
MPIPRFLRSVPVAALVLVGACAPADGPAPPPDAPAAEREGRAYVYDCADAGFRFTAWVAPDSMDVRLPAGLGRAPVRIPRVEAASGARYEGEGVEVWTLEREAMLRVDGDDHSPCALDSQASIWEDARLRGVSFRGVGNEPGWLVEIRGDGSAKLLLDYGERELTIPAMDVDSSAADSRTIYRAVTDSHEVEVTIETEWCPDSMSDETFDHTVALTVDDRSYRGCGRWLGADAPGQGPRSAFDPDADLLALHYDHAPDRDDGQSAVADRVMLETELGAAWIARNALAVSGAYGENAADFDAGSDAVMDAVFGDVGGWLAAHGDRAAALDRMTDRWLGTLRAGGDVWVKEGGQSDLTAEVVARVQEALPDADTRSRIHVVQHSDWNEDMTTDAALAFVREYTDYVRIRDANAYLNLEGGDRAFEAAALAHDRFGAMWAAAFAYYPPAERLDFSDTGELMHILGVDEMGIDAFRARYLDADADDR